MTTTAASSAPPSAAVLDGAVCTPNIGAEGKRRRRNIAAVGAVAAVALLVAFVAVHAAWFWRLTLFLPAAGAAVSGLQVRRNTCVARAREGVIEHDDFSTTRADPVALAASRRVASTILRDGVLIGLLAAALGAASSLLA